LFWLPFQLPFGITCGNFSAFVRLCAALGIIFALLICGIISGSISGALGRLRASGSRAQDGGAFPSENPLDFQQGGFKRLAAKL